MEEAKELQTELIQESIDDADVDSEAEAEKESEEEAEAVEPIESTGEGESGVCSESFDAKDAAVKTIIVDKNVDEQAGGHTDKFTDEHDDAQKDAAEEAEDSETSDDEALESAAEMSDADKEIVERITLRKLEAQKKKSRFKRRLITFVVLLVLAVVAFGLSLTSIFTVDSIEVEGNSHYTDEEIISIGHAVPGKNLIYHPNKAAIKENLELNPYIKSAEVSRKFPSTLKIRVIERTQMMALSYDDDYLILDSEGVLLQKSRTKPKLTIIEGNVITKIKPGEELGTKDSSLLKKTVELMQTMSESDLYFVKVDMSDQGNIKAYVYDSLIVKNDYDTLMENMTNGKLHKVLDKLFSESIKRGTITFNEDGSSTFMPGI